MHKKTFCKKGKLKGKGCGELAVTVPNQLCELMSTELAERASPSYVH